MAIGTAAFRALGLVALTTVGCGGGADVKVAFERLANTSARQTLVATGDQAGNQGPAASAGRTPAVFGMKLVIMYLVEDITGDGNSVGAVARIWNNPVCDAENYRCSIEPEAGPYQVKEYFDLALPSDEVNRRLNSQGQVIKPGSYRYLHMDMAGPSSPSVPSHTPNLRFGDVVETAREARMGNGMWVKLEPPLILGDGDVATVRLGYDVTGSYFEGDVDSNHPAAGATFNDWTCGDASGGVARGQCLHFTGFSPSIVRGGDGTTKVVADKP